jgi:hypothetical protein
VAHPETVTYTLPSDTGKSQNGTGMGAETEERSREPPIAYAEIAQAVGLLVGRCRRVVSQVRRGPDPFLSRSVPKRPTLHEEGGAAHKAPVRNDPNQRLAGDS